MIYTVTLNSALDLELDVPEIGYDRVLRASSVRVDNGGKGFNIARNLAMLDVPCLALGLVGGKTGERLVEELARQGVLTDLDWIAGETRTNVHIVDLKSRRYIKVNQPGPTVLPGDLDELSSKVRARAKSGDIWVFAGSLPPGLPPDTYVPMVAAVQAAGGMALIDADGATLRQTCLERPYLVKPNALEAGQLAGIEVSSPKDALRAAGAIHEMMVQAVLITLGKDGAVLSQNGQAWWAAPPVIAVDIPTGAGDATMAGYIWGLSQGAAPPEALRLGVASGTASASLPGTAVAGRELIEQTAASVRITRFVSPQD